MPAIIVSYRRSDSKWITGRIVDRLERDFGQGEVFVDVDAIPPGIDFRDHLRTVLAQCDVLLAIVGPNWLAADHAGRPRLFDPADWVRVEIETALASRVPVIPVLIDRVAMPGASDLPESLQGFAFRQAADLDTGRDFHVHMDRLVRAIRQAAAARAQSPEPTLAPRREPLETDPTVLRHDASETADAVDPREVESTEKVLPPRPPTPNLPKPDFGKPDLGKPDLQTPDLQTPGWLNASRQEKDERASVAEGEPQGRVWSGRLVIFLVVLFVSGAFVIWQLIDVRRPRPEIVVKAPEVITRSSEPAKGTPARDEAAKAVLYEEDPAEPQGRRFAGSTIWLNERLSLKDRADDIGILAEVMIPEREMTMRLTVRRNDDASLPASHLIEIIVRLPKNFDGGSVTSVPGVLMKANEQARGAPLSGHAVQVTSGYFLIGLSSAPADREHNVRMLKERGWFDIPLVYANNRRAILAIEKGASGERVFAQVFQAWGP